MRGEQRALFIRGALQQVELPEAGYLIQVGVAVLPDVDEVLFPAGRDANRFMAIYMGCLPDAGYGFW